MPNFCVNRDNKPTTCCCGCSLTCGVITYGVFQCLNLLGAFVSLNIGSIAFAVISASPVLALAIWRDSYAVRNINYIWQWIIFGGFGLFMLFAFILITMGTQFIDMLCKHGVSTASEGGDLDDQPLDNDEVYEHCSNFLSSFAYIIWGSVLLTVTPLQLLWISIFHGYRDELEQPDAGADGESYQALNREEI